MPLRASSSIDHATKSRVPSTFRLYTGTRRRSMNDYGRRFHAVYRSNRRTIEALYGNLESGVCVCIRIYVLAIEISTSACSFIFCTGRIGPGKRELRFRISAPRICSRLSSPHSFMVVAARRACRIAEQPRTSSLPHATHSSATEAFISSHVPLGMSSTIVRAGPRCRITH